LHGLASSIGGGADLDLNARLALRAAQLDYDILRINRRTWRGFRWSFGVVFKFDAQ
jgi:hypothetical protein